MNLKVHVPWKRCPRGKKILYIVGINNNITRRKLKIFLNLLNFLIPLLKRNLGVKTRGEIFEFSDREGGYFAEDNC